MADDKKPLPEFGAKPSKEQPMQSTAEMALELEALRRELAEIKAKPPGDFIHLPVGDVNETAAGEEDGVPMFWYRIDLPPSGGTDIKLCGMAFYHGQSYKVTVDQLRSLREIVARCWGHEEQIRGSNENFYRKPTNRVLSGGERR